MDMRWPDGRRAAAAFTFDVDAEAVWIGFDKANANRPGVLSQGSYGPKVGVGLILDVLRSHGVRASFFVPGINVERHREVLELIAAGGHEIAVHGYTHTAPALLSREEEERELDRAYDNVVSLGTPPLGYRSPSWDVSDSTLDLLESKGILYASNFMDDLRPYRHPGRRLVELPIQWNFRMTGHISSTRVPGSTASRRSAALTRWSRSGSRSSRASATSVGASS